MSPRELWVFVKHLPPESWTQTKLRDSGLTELVAEEVTDPVVTPWSQGDYLMAALIDAVNHNTYVTAVAGRFKDPKVPEPTPRPGLQRRPAPVLSEAAVIYLNARRAPREATT